MIDQAPPPTLPPSPPSQPAAERAVAAWLARARRRLWLRRALVPVTAGIDLGLLTLAFALVIGIALVPAPLLVAALFALAGLLVAALRRPAPSEVARIVDRELGLRERLTTATELLFGGRSAPLATHQIDQTADLLRRVSPGEAFRLGPALAPALTVLAGAFVLTGLALIIGAGLPNRTPAVARADLPLPAGAAATAPAGGPPAPLPSESNAAAGSEAAAQFNESQRQQAALNRLADALGGTAAARDAADALRGGDAQGAADRLSELARENDQLSPQARQELTDALRQAAADSASAPLAQSERAAAEALAGGDYRRTERALSELGQQVQQRAEQQTPYQELAGALAESGGQPSASGQQSSSGGDRPLESNPGDPGDPGAPGDQAGGGSGGNQPGAAGNGPGGARQPGSGARLGVDGVPVELDPEGEEGSGRAADPNAPPPVRTRLGPGTSGTTSLGTSSDTPVQTTENPREAPVDARGAVRDYLIPSTGEDASR